MDILFKASTVVVAMSMALGAFILPAQAAPGLAEKIYGATVEPGVTELESRYGRIQGGADDGEDALVLELAHGFSRKFYGAVLTEFTRDPHGKRKLDAFALEGIYSVGRANSLGLDVALYGEYEAARGGPDKLETKLLLQHRQGTFDGRLNLVAERQLVSGRPVAFEYAASADWEVADDFRLGGAAFGELGNSDRLSTRGEHFAGPVGKYEFEHLGKGELGIEAGYLFALGSARKQAGGQLRLLVEYETKF